MQQIFNYIFDKTHNPLCVSFAPPFFLRSCIGVRPGVGAFFFSETQVYRDSTNREICRAVSEKYYLYEINKYRYNIGPIGHDPYGLISYLTAKYQTFQSENVSGDISELFNRLYDLSFKEITEQRQKTVTYTEDGVTKTKTVTYTVKILETTLNE